MMENREIEDNIGFDSIKEGEKIRVKKDKVFESHFLKCQDGWKIDLSEWCTVWKRENGVMMCGNISLASYKNKDIERLVEEL